MKRIYTRTGDLGETSLLGGPRVAKDTPRIETCGRIDELNAQIGLARADLESTVFPAPKADPDSENLAPTALIAILCRIQDELFILGGELSSRNPSECGVRMIDDEMIQALERDIDRCVEMLLPQTTFLRPGGVRASAQLHVARTSCRCAERQIIRFMREPYDDVSRRPLAYLNRMSDLLFVIARVVNLLAGREEESPGTKA